MSILLQAVNYTRTLATPLSSKLASSHPVGHFSRRRVNLSPGANYSVVIPALNPEDVNSVVNVLFQVCCIVCMAWSQIGKEIVATHADMNGG